MDGWPHAGREGGWRRATVWQALARGSTATAHPVPTNEREHDASVPLRGALTSKDSLSARTTVGAKGARYIRSKSFDLGF